METNEKSLKTHWRTQRLRNDRMYGVQLEDTELDKEWQELCDLVRYENVEDEQATTCLRFLEAVHVFSLSNMLQRPIILFSEDVIRNKYGEAISINDLSTTQKVSNNRPSKAQINNRIIREQSSSIYLYNYSQMTQITTRQIPYSHNHDQYSLTNYQKYSSHDSFKYVIPSQEQAYDQVKYTQIASDESNAFNHYFDLEGQYLPEVLFNESLERYSPQQMSIIPYNDFSNIERIDIQHILNPIQQDYFHTVQPYASSVTFKNNYEDDRLLVDNESTTAAPIQTGSFLLSI
ncbi:unnamed protein product [Rotaria sordida]|uniref:Uncharacterized protein n=1 Tax=Rotaria sordida TaxID=392033 RepID=A0A815BNZ6_9BILA|nr:unnamed protein product [Rotaria sordida]CAF1554680.1 unnamed protein product [Rotaria sordida]